MNRLFPALLCIVLCLVTSACGGKPQPLEQEASAETEPASKPQVAAITPAMAQSAGIEVLAAGPAEIRETVKLYGTVKANAERRQEVRARYAGAVRAVAKRPGDRVAKGELLLSVESNDSLEPYAIRSPIAGTVLERRVNPGEAIDGSSTLMVIADLSSVWVEFAVFTRDLARLRAGQAVRVESADTQAAAETKIAYVAPSGDAGSQSVVARAVLDNRDGRWVAGQFVSGEAVVAQVQAAVAVVPAALQMVHGKPVAFIAEAQGYTAREVQLGARSAQAVEIVGGLAAGERYVARNSYLLKAETLKGEAEEE